MREEDLIYKAAALYFEENQTQQQIAHQLGISRVKVSRTLQQARLRGIVEITLNKPQQSYSDEEKNIAKKYDLMEVLLSPTITTNKDDQLQMLGQTASVYAQRVLPGVESVCLAWGSSLSSFIHNITKIELPRLKIVQMLGGLGSPEADVYSSDLVRRLSDKTGGTGRILSAPGVVSSSEVKKGLLEDPYIKETLEMAAGADIAFVGIGTAEPDSILMSQGKILPKNTLTDIKRTGAVGDISLRFFNSDGSIVSHGINKRIIGLSSSEIKKIPRVVAIAGGVEKYNAIKGALKSGLINVLITDYETSIKLMKES